MRINIASMTLRLESRCPGSERQMVYRTYEVRQIEEGDRAKWEGWAQAKEARGEFGTAQMARDSLRQ